MREPGTDWTGHQCTGHPETPTVTQRLRHAASGQPWILEMGNLVQQRKVPTLCIFISNSEVEESQFL